MKTLPEQTHESKQAPRTCRGLDPREVAQALTRARSIAEAARNIGRDPRALARFVRRRKALAAEWATLLDARRHAHAEAEAEARTLSAELAKRAASLTHTETTMQIAKVDAARERAAELRASYRARSGAA